MNRRRFIADVALTGLCGGVGTASATSATARSPSSNASASAQSPPGVAWQRTYENVDVGAVAPAHGGGHVVVNHGQRFTDQPLRLALLDENGTVRRRREVDAPSDARVARADVVQRDDGYAVAIGTWFAALGLDLTVRTTGFAPEFESGHNTRVATHPDGFVVANDGSGVRGEVRTTVLGYGLDGTLQWTWEYDGGDGNPATALRFLLDGSDGGLVVGGYRRGTVIPWLAGLAADGTERWKTSVTEARGGGTDATVTDGEITLSGDSHLVHLNADRSIAWQRTFDEFHDRIPERLVRTADGGYLTAQMAGAARPFVGKTDANGRLQWTREYTGFAGDADAFYDLTDIVERAPGEYLLVGVERDAPAGWAVLLSDSLTPTPRPTSTPTPPPTQSSSRTPTRADTPTATRSPTSTATTTTRPTSGSETEAETGSPIPGFGVGTALAGAAGLAVGWLARRR